MSTEICANLRLSLVLAFAVTSMGAGYVQELGPPAMRWQAPSFARFELLSFLPPLDMGKKAPGTESGTNQPATAISTNLFSGAGVELGMVSTNETTTQVTTYTPGLPYDARGLLSPEWLATIFYTPQGTNDIGTVVMPMPFIPPQVPLSSSATFIKGTP